MSLNIYPIGQQVRVEGTFTDIDGAKQDPTSVTVEYVKPDGTAVSPEAATKDATGEYHHLKTPDAEGIWHYKMAGTGAYVAAEIGAFRVDDGPFTT